MYEPTHIDLFSGIGGFALAAREVGFRTVAFCEIDPYCQRVLTKNFMADAAGSRRNGQAREHDGGCALPSSRLSKRGRGTPSLHGNIFDFDGTAYRGAALLTGGFPCQPFSVAGKRRGAADDRYLWPEMLRVIAEARPAWVLGENVPGFATMEQFDMSLEMEDDGSAKGELGTVVNRVGRGIADEAVEALEALGYAVHPFVIPACAVDARHRRDRLWIVGHSTRDEQRGIRRPRIGTEPASETQQTGRASADVTDTESTGLEGLRPPAGQPQISEPRNGSALADAEKFTERESTDETNTFATARRTWDESGNGGSVPDAGRNKTTRHGRSKRSTGERCEWLPEPDVGRVAHGIPSELDFIRRIENEHDTQEANSETRFIVWQILRAMWEHRKTSKASSDAYRQRLCDLVPTMPREQAYSGWLLGKRIEENEELCSLWQDFYAASFQEAQDLQHRLLERIGAQKRPKALGSRVDRLKGLGNAIVPQVAFEILREIKKLT